MKRTTEYIPGYQPASLTRRILIGDLRMEEAEAEELIAMLEEARNGRKADVDLVVYTRWAERQVPPPKWQSALMFASMVICIATLAVAVLS